MSETVTFSNRAKREDGFFLVELAITLAIIGIIIAGAVQFYQYFTLRHSQLETDRKMDIVMRAVSNYAQARWRIPCPADPDASNTPANQPFGSERATCNTNALANGIIPYRTLGIPEYYVKDGHGNYFTYIVSPVFARIVTIGAGNNVNLRQAYYLAPENAGLIPAAQFCGAAPAIPAVTDLQVQQTIAGIVQPFGAPRTINSGGNSFDININTLYGTPGRGAPDAAFNRNINATAFAIALISHGANGVGAYNTDGTRSGDDNGLSGAEEQSLAGTGNQLLIDREIRRAAANNEFDDRFMVLTQDQLWAYGGGGSCEEP